MLLTAPMLGLLVGLVLGLTGAGGLTFAVPLLMWGLGWSLPEAVPVALIAVCIAAGFGTLVAWDVTVVRYRAALLQGRTVPWLVALPFVGGALVGHAGGQQTGAAHRLSRLQQAFAVAILGEAVALALPYLVPIT